MKKGVFFPVLLTLACCLALSCLTSCWISKHKEIDPWEDAAEDFIEPDILLDTPVEDEQHDVPMDEISSDDPMFDDIEEEDGCEIVSTTWARSYELLINTWGYAIQPIECEGYIVAGYGYYESPSLDYMIVDVWALKLDLDGNVIWQNRYGREERDEKAKDVALTPDNGFMVVGRADSLTIDGGPGEFDFMAMRLDADGKLEWFKTYGNERWDEANAVVQTSDGGYLLTGDFYNESSILLIKIDDTGNVLWAKTFDTDKRDTAYDIEATLDGGYVLVGETRSYGPSRVPSDILIIKIDAEGTIVWQKLFDGNFDQCPWDIHAASDGGYLVAGSMPYTQAPVFKLDHAGNLQWLTCFEGNGAEVHGVQEIPSGMIIAAGTRFDTLDAWIMALDASGALLWQRNYGGNELDIFEALALAPDGGLATVGYTTSFDSTNERFWVLKTDEAGLFEGLCPPGLGETGSLEISECSATVQDADFQAADVDVTVTTYDAITFATSATVLDQCEPR